MYKGAVAIIALAITVSAVPSALGKQYYGSTSKSVSLSAAKGSNTKAASSTTAKVKSTELWKSGVKQLAAKKYSEAADHFEYIDAHGGCCDETHYYLALCYQGENQTVLAQMHYQWVTSNSKNARLRQYANYANDQLAYYQAHRTYSGQGAVPVSYGFG